MEEKKIITEEVEKNFVNTVLRFIIKEGLTVGNVKVAMNDIYTYFEENATLEKTTEV